MNKYYSINEFAKLINVSAQTLRNWDKKGKLTPHHISDNGYRYYSYEQLQQILNGNYRVYDDKFDEIYINTIITLSELYYDSVSIKTKNIMAQIRKLIQEGDAIDKDTKN